MNIEYEVVGKWVDVLSALGVDHRFLANKHGPCPFCGGKDRYRFDNRDGNGTFYCNHCGAGNGFTFLNKMFNWDFKTSANEIRQIIGDCRRVIMPKKDPRVALKKIASMSKSIESGSDLIKYLSKRGITSCPNSLKEAQLYYYEEGIKIGPFPTMVALITNHLGKGISYHLTYTHKQEKLKCTAPKKIMTPIMPIKGSYVELYPIEEHICVTEGIETALAIRDLTEKPVISALSAQNLVELSLPSEVKKVEIWGDNDASYCGQRASYTLAEKLKRKGIDVEVYIPPNTGEDWLDFINKNKEMRLEEVKQTHPEFHQGITKLMETFDTKNVTITRDVA